MIKLLFAFLAALPLFAEVIDREGNSYLEVVEGQRILHLKGSPYEMGYAHGKLLKAEIQQNIERFIDKKKEGFEERTKAFTLNLVKLMGYTPERFLEEMRGMATGSRVPLNKILLLNLFPEMFHCSGIVASGSATKNHDLYHARVLDYSIGKGLSETAVLIVAEPNNRIPFLNVTYAGFIGSVTGMNAEKIAIGEIGGKGYGSWDGMPMAFLMREMLENADTLERTKEILSEAKRTCEYYYVISDGKSKSAIGVYATAETLQFIEPSSTYTIASLDHPEGNTFEQLQDCVVLTGCDRYPTLFKRMKKYYGRINEDVMQKILLSPVSRPDNLHNAIFRPSRLQVWISHASPSGEPACNEPYSSFSLTELLSPR